MQSLPFPGDVVWIRQQRWRVRRALRDGNVVRLDVTSRSRALTFLAPFDRVVVDRAVGRPRRVRRQEVQGRLASLVGRAPDPRLPLTLIDARLDILPHQLEPVLAMLAGHSRVLLADEVGLGKTIQAAIVIAEVMRREAAPRVLVLAPAPLCLQWIDELGHRFHLRAERADRDGLQALTRVIPHGENPWRRARLWIGSPDYMKQSHVIASLPADPWDLVVVDEAHAVAGESERHEACETIARHARRVLFLTATPHTGDEPRFQRLLALGALPGSPPPIVFRRTRASLGVTGTRVVRWHRVTPSDAECAALDCLRSYERTVLAVAGRDESGALLLLSVLRKRALSTFAALGATIARRLSWIDAASPLAEYTPYLPWDADADASDLDEREAVRVRLAIDPRRESLWLQRLKRLVDAAARSESKAVRLARLIERTTEPVVVFTEFRDSLEVALRQLRLNRSVAWIHGGLDAAEQRSQLRRFLTGSASILLATDVAGQGLNLQDAARWVISLEVPWNPARLEQRIGRVDRIGQRRRAHLTVLVSRHEAESGLLLHLTRRVLRARAALGDGVLIDAPVAESRIAARLFDRSGTADEPEPGATHATINSSRHWRRAAAVIGRALTKRRHLARRWRPPATSSELLQIVSRDSLRNDLTDRLIVTAAPLVNGLDELVAVVVTPCRVAAWAARAGVTRCVAVVQKLAAASIARRIRRLERREAIVACRLDARDRLIAEAHRANSAPGELQPGLFDQREIATHEAALMDIAALESSQGERIERRTAGGSLRAGEPGVIITLHRTGRSGRAD